MSALFPVQASRAHPALVAENRRAINNIINCNYPYEGCDVDYQLSVLKEQLQGEIAALQAQVDEINLRLGLDD